MKRYHQTVTHSAIYFRETPTNKGVNEQVSLLLKETLESVGQKSGVKQTLANVGGATVQTQEGQLLLLFIATVDQTPREETP